MVAPLRPTFVQKLAADGGRNLASGTPLQADLRESCTGPG
jgi:hypothetical protein